MPPDRILIVEDDVEMAAVLRQGFEQDHLLVDVAGNGREGVSAARKQRFQLIILDVMLPLLDGYAVASELRADGQRTPILMLTARDSVTDIVHGLESGVDDYLTKPFSFLELRARVRSLIRRAASSTNLLVVGDLVLDIARHQVARRGEPIHLTKTEFHLLVALMRHVGETVRRPELLREVWGANATVEGNTLDVSISSLRSRIERPGQPRLIHTVRGFGYRIEAAE